MGCLPEPFALETPALTLVRGALLSMRVIAQVRDFLHLVLLDIGDLKITGRGLPGGGIVIDGAGG